ncbi:hypothetical protein [Paractinoplanes rishiriensis]|nr:hypothetical protein [Actinoplanes rishiriensis]
MNLLQMVGGVAAAGVVAAGTTALTGTGLATTAGASQFVGGTVSQSVTGATLESVTYAFSDGTKTIVNSVTLAFSTGTATGKTVTITPTGGAYAGTAIGGSWTCATGADSTLCTVKDSSAAAVTGPANGWSGLTSLAITVA